MTEVHLFGVDPINCHAFNHGKDKLAISQNSNEVQIHSRDPNRGWVQETVLDKHELRISSIDWAPKTNRIVTCSADRNAYVWTCKDGKWKPDLVWLRINRAATCVRWSPDETKFAVGSGAKLTSVCHFDESGDWWVSKHIKKAIKSTVTCVDWHPNSVILACGSTDYKVRVYNAYIKEVDGSEPPVSTKWGPSSGNFGLLAEFSAAAGSWIHSVGFSPDGDRLAWASHDSCISVADVTKSPPAVTLKTRFLPCLSLVWSSPCSIVAVGHDCYPMLFMYDKATGSLDFGDKLDKSEKKETDGFSAMRKFHDLDRRGIENHAGPGGDSLDTIHQNTIVEVRVHASGSENKVSTVSLDGKLVIWDVSKSLNQAMKGLKIRS